MCGLTLDQIRPMCGDFERKHYTNPTLMWEILLNSGVSWEASGIGWEARQFGRQHLFPSSGLARIQWEGPWTQPGVPIAARYRHTHWVGSFRTPGKDMIFDVNCMCVGGWVPLSEWSEFVVPWLLRQCEPKANGKWHITHAVEIATTQEGQP